METALFRSAVIFFMLSFQFCALRAYSQPTYDTTPYVDQSYFGSSNDDFVTAIFKYGDDFLVCGSTYLGGEIVFPETDSIAGDSTLNIFVSRVSGQLDYVVKTHIFGGSGMDMLTAAKLDSSGHLVLAGTTNSVDFPVTSNAFQGVMQGGDDLFFMSLTEAFDSIEFATYYGGSEMEMAASIDLDSLGNLYCLANTNSADLAMADSVFIGENYMGEGDVVFLKFNATLDSLLSSSYLGGSMMDYAADIKVHEDSLLLVLINSEFIDLSSLDENPLSTADRNTYVFQTDLDFTQIYAAKSIGGSQLDVGNALLSSDSSVYVTGYTYSHNFPTDEDAFIPEMMMVDPVQAFLMHFSLDLDSLKHSTFVGSHSGHDAGIELGYFDDQLILLGVSDSLDFPQTLPRYGSDEMDRQNLFVSVFDPSLQLLNSWLMGGAGFDGYSDSLDIMNDLYYHPDFYSDVKTHRGNANFLFQDTLNVALAFQTISIDSSETLVNADLQVDFVNYDMLYNGGLDIFIYNFDMDNYPCAGGGPGFSPFSSQPISVEICEGSDTMFWITTSIPDPFYQWYRIDGDSLIALTDTVLYEGINNDTLKLYNVPIEMNGWRYTCLAIDNFHYYYSIPATLFVYSIDVEVAVEVLPSFTGDPDYPIVCPGDSVSLMAQGAAQYLWSTGDSTAVIDYFPSLSDSIWVMGYNLDCGADTAYLYVEVLPPIDPLALSASADTICAGDSIWFSVSGDVESFLWSDGSVSAELVVTPYTNTVYSVIGYSSDGCSVEDSISVEVHPLPSILATIYPETCWDFDDGSIEIEVLSDTTAFVLWFDGSTDTQVSGLDTGIYFVEVSTIFGCTVYEEFEIVNDSSGCIYSFFIPNIFSPNDDALNDYLFVRGNEIESFQFILFDQSGNRVFQTNSMLESWDGRYRGSNCPSGVYYYHLLGSYTNGVSFEKRGNITLIR